MKGYIESQAKKDYHKLSKDIKKLFTENEYIELVIKKYNKIKEKEQ